MNMMKGRFLLPVLCCFCLASCAPLFFFGAGTVAGVVTYKYYKGTLTVIYQAPIMKTWDATLKVLEEMKLKIDTKDHDRTSGKIVAVRADGKPVIISLAYISSRETEVVIRVGFFGDKNISMIIKEEIRKGLI
jgi:hypothetical protein